LVVIGNKLKLFDSSINFYFEQVKYETQYEFIGTNMSFYN
jgi:hypothetical protein